jgi:hypothetical protein
MLSMVLLTLFYAYRTEAAILKSCMQDFYLPEKKKTKACVLLTTLNTFNDFYENLSYASVFIKSDRDRHEGTINLWFHIKSKTINK